MSSSDDAIERTPGFRFDAFRLDHRGGLCRLNGPGEAEPVALGSRALDVLKTLVESDGGPGPGSRTSLPCAKRGKATPRRSWRCGGGRRAQSA